ncbi:MAG TPA: alpha/beta hydrolase [Burkholderiaceae bacterium]
MSSFLQAVELHGQALEIEAHWLAPAAPKPAAPRLVFLHEGLGSLSQWGAFPQALCNAAGCAGLVFSRPGYGRSTPRTEPWPGDYLQRQARDLLPACFAALGIAPDERIVLVGHSDGASLALLFAAAFPARMQAVVAMAPHLFVEACTLAGLRRARAAYEAPDSGLNRALTRHHADTDSAFYGWNDAWLRPGFADWNIEAELCSGLNCPTLALQGVDDEYGTLAQIEAVARVNAGATRVLGLSDCGHAPQRDQPEAVLAAICELIKHGML